MKTGRSPLLAVLPGLLAVALLVAGCTSSATSATSDPNGTSPQALPLAVAGVAGTASYVILPMGVLSSPLNTFWQLLVANPSQRSWRVTTPKGVADNGGLVASSSAHNPPDFEVGVIASEKLGFSPDATSTDEGRSWTPGVLAGTLSPAPSSLVQLASGQSVYLSGPDGSRVVESSPADGAGRTVVSLAALRSDPSTRSCGLTALTTLTTVPSGALVVGGSCSKPGHIGLYAERAGRWLAVAPNLAGRAHTADATVVTAVRSSDSTAGTTILVSLSTRHSRSIGLVALGHTASPSPLWSIEGNIAFLPGGMHLQAIAGGPRKLAVAIASGTVRSPADERLETFYRRAWSAASPLPAGTQAIAVTTTTTTTSSSSSSSSSSTVTAFVVHRSELVVERQSGSTWHVVQHVDVPLAYGSSG